MAKFDYLADDDAYDFNALRGRGWLEPAQRAALSEESSREIACNTFFMTRDQLIAFYRRRGIVK